MSLGGLQLGLAGVWRTVARKVANRPELAGRDAWEVLFYLVEDGNISGERAAVLTGLARITAALDPELGGFRQL
jgi:hypothetical protein